MNEEPVPEDPILLLAREMLPQPKSIKVFLCPECGIEYDGIEEAHECCPRDIETEERFVCPKCNEYYEKFDEAQECCEETDGIFDRK